MHALVPQEGNHMEMAIAKFITPHQTHVEALIMNLHEHMKYNGQKIEEIFEELEQRINDALMDEDEQ